MDMQFLGDMLKYSSFIVRPSNRQSSQIWDFVLQGRPVGIYMCVTESFHLKGLFTKKILSLKSHILDSNEVWYSWFWSEGSIKAQTQNVVS